MENYSTNTGLAFAMAGDNRMHTTRRKIARVPLSDYIMPVPQSVDDANGSQSMVSAVYNEVNGPTAQAQTPSVGGLPAPEPPQANEHDTRLHEHCTTLLRWQEAQSIQVHIDARFRFRCLLHWLQARGRITAVAAGFLQKHVGDQYELLLTEDRNLQDIMQVRQKEGLSLTKAQESRVVDVDEDLQQAAEAIKKVDGLVGLAMTMGLVEGEVSGGGVVLDAGEHSENGQAADADMELAVDSSSDGL